VRLRKWHRDGVNRLVNRCCDQVPCIPIEVVPGFVELEVAVPA
jgi:hypothetical protein